MTAIKYIFKIKMLHNTMILLLPISLFLKAFELCSAVSDH